jgi:hypothetical protein
MPTSSGPNIAGESNLVFKYDTGDIRNSYKGKPTTNLLTGIGKSGTNDGTYFKTNSGTEVKYVPNVGVRTIHYVNIFNDYYGGSGICCPAPMSFGDFTVSPSTQYTYQIIYRTTTRYANANYMYHYEYNTGTYVTEYGLWSSSRETDLGGGWKHAWGTFTSNASTNRFVTYLFHYEYGVWNKIEVAGIMLTQGNNIIPPTQFLDVGTTRSATQGLLPLVGNSTIDLSNVSFDSNGQIVFDGTDDKIHDISVVHSYLNSSAIEFVVTPETIGRRMTIGGYRQNSGYSSPTIGMVYIESDNKFYASVITTAEVYRFVVSTTTIQANGTYHVVFNKDTSAGVMRLYVNGVAEGAQTFNAATYAQWSSAGSYIGSDIIDLGKSFNTNSGQGWGGDFLDGKIHNFKLYSRILTAQEIQSNYLQYKTRFNLS